MTSPTHQLSMFLVGVLAPLVGQTSSYVKNSKSFAVFIITQAVTKKEILVSFNVVSVYLHSNRSGCPGNSSKTRRGPIPPGRTDLSVDEIVGLLTLRLDATFLSFWGEGLPTSTWYCNGIPGVRSDCEPCNGGC